jgi:hypothetical protein
MVLLMEALSKEGATMMAEMDGRRRSVTEDTMNDNDK